MTAMYSKKKQIISDTWKMVVYLLLHVLTFFIIFSYFILSPTEQVDIIFFRNVIIFFASVLLTKYFVYMLISPWHDIVVGYQKYLNSLKRRSGKIFCPKVSVIIPAWNEEAGVITTIKSLLKSTHTNLEIVAVNNASTDNTEKNILKLIDEWESSLDGSLSTVSIKYFYEGKQGKGHALNRGIDEATGDIVMSIDADCFVTPQAVANFVAPFEDSRVMAAVGNVKIGNTKTILGVVQYLEFLFSFYFKKADSLINSIYIIGGAAGAFRKEVFHKIGKYNHSNITEEIELSVRIQDAGMKIVYVDDAVIYTEGATTLKGLMKQRLRWKRGRFETFIANRHLFFSRNKNHNPILTWGVLPFAIFGDIQLSLEVLFLGFLYIYSYLTNDYTSFISGIVVVSSMFLVQALFDRNDEVRKLGFYFLAPIGWLLFYVSTVVEVNALIKSFWGYFRGTELKWQNWQRAGVLNS